VAGRQDTPGRRDGGKSDDCGINLVNREDGAYRASRGWRAAAVRRCVAGSPLAGTMTADPTIAESTW
jgi:hypothetical protein